MVKDCQYQRQRHLCLVFQPPNPNSLILASESFILANLSISHTLYGTNLFSHNDIFDHPRHSITTPMGQPSGRKIIHPPARKSLHITFVNPISDSSRVTIFWLEFKLKNTKKKKTDFLFFPINKCFLWIYLLLRNVAKNHSYCYTLRS